MVSHDVCTTWVRERWAFEEMKAMAWTSIAMFAHCASNWSEHFHSMACNLQDAPWAQNWSDHSMHKWVDAACTWSGCVSAG